MGQEGHAVPVVADNQVLGEAAIEIPTGVGEALLYLFLAHLHGFPTCIGHVLSLYHRKEASETIGSDSKAEWSKVCRRSLSTHRVAEKGYSRKLGFRL